MLVEFLEDDYEDEHDLVLIGVNGIWSVFELQVSILQPLLRRGTLKLKVNYRVQLQRMTSAGYYLGILFWIPYRWS